MQVRIVAPEPKKAKWYEPTRYHGTGPHFHVMLRGAPVTVGIRVLNGCVASVAHFLLVKDPKRVDALLLQLLDGELEGGLFWISAASEYIEVLEGE